MLEPLGLAAALSFPYGERLSSTGKRPGASGRKTSAYSRTPSRVRIGTPRSTTTS